MYQIVELSDEEKFEMYMKLSKEALVEMLIEAGKHLDPLTNSPIYEKLNPSEDFYKTM